MEPKIYVEPCDTWEYFQDNKEDLIEKMHVIACNDNTGVTVYITTDDDGDYPVFTVTEDSEELQSEYAFDSMDATRTAKKLYEKYLDREKQDEEEEQEELTQEELINGREADLFDAVIDFVEAATDGGFVNTNLSDEDIEDIKDHFLEYIYRKHGVDIYRPMCLVTPAGEEFYEEYPYDSMIFDDLNNPVYKNEVKDE